MNESHTCLKFWWAPHHRTIFLTYYYCWFSLALFRRAYCAFNVFFFLIDSTRICVFTKSWRLILNWNMDGKILDSFHSWCEFHQKITRIYQTDAGIPWHSHMRHAVGNIEMCKQLNGWALPLLFFLLFLLTMVLVLVLLLLPLFFRMDHIRALFIARLSVLCSHCIIIMSNTDVWVQTHSRMFSRMIQCGLKKQQQKTNNEYRLVDAPNSRIFLWLVNGESER